MIINSLLDSDFYKFTMGALAFHFKPYKKKIAEYSLKVRSGHDLIPLKKQLKAEIDYWLSLKFTEDEIEYLASREVNGTKVFKEEYIVFLKNIDLKQNIKYRIVIEKGHLNIRVKGDWKYAIYAEVPFLAIIQELYWKNNLSPEEYEKAELEFENRLEAKIEYVKKTKIKFSEFGTRRRFSQKLQELATSEFKSKCPENMISTSNVLLAKELRIPVSGTIAHEAFQAFQALAFSFETSQKETLQTWLTIYPDKLKIALSDIFGTDIFLLDFTKDLAEDYDGVRQDSGVPREVALKHKAHYEKLGIDTKTKTMLFSDDLNFEKANELEKEFGSVFKVLFGIGTFCSNDTGHKPVSIVMKMVRMNGIDVIKMSDTPGKVMCENPEVIEKTKKYIAERIKKNE